MSAEHTDSIPAADIPARPLPTASSGWWRFSIRELLLLTAAVAAFLAWAGLAYQRSQPYRRTAIPDLLANYQDVHAICRTLGHRPSSYASGGGGGSSPRATNRTYDVNVDFPAKRRGEFMAEYRQHIRDILDKQADRVGGTGTMSDGSGLRGFDFEYTKGRVRGTVVVRAAAGGEGLSLFIFIHEYDSRP